MTPTWPEAPDANDPGRPLRHLARDVPPPPDLEDVVVERLVADGLAVRGAAAAQWRRGLRVAAALAAGLVLFAGGWMGGRATGGAVATPAAGRLFMLLLYEDDGFDHSAGTAALVAEYSAWGRALRQSGALVAAEKLADDGGLLEGPPGGTTLRSGTPLADAGVVTGYFVVSAGSFAEARRIAQGSPHLKYGGRIAIREIERT